MIHLHYIGKSTYILLFFKLKNLIISPWGVISNFKQKFNKKENSSEIIKQIQFNYC